MALGPWVRGSLKTVPSSSSNFALRHHLHLLHCSFRFRFCFGSFAHLTRFRCRRNASKSRRRHRHRRRRPTIFLQVTSLSLSLSLSTLVVRDTRQLFDLVSVDAIGSCLDEFLVTTDEVAIAESLKIVPK